LGEAEPLWVKIAASVGFLGVALGAFGAHGLRGRIPENLMSAYQTGVLYHLVHAVALLALALHARVTSHSIAIEGALMLAGIVLFSGSLYALAVSGVGRFGMITPFGGLCFLAAWATILFRLAAR
jgi:uncharacterized membrane protein YgdD (TMEM256/DUF423 family)